MRWADGNPVCQDAFNALDGGTVLPALVGLASGAQAVNGMLQSDLFDTSSFNTPAAAGFWRSYSPADPSRIPWPPVMAEDVGGISGRQQLLCTGPVPQQPPGSCPQLRSAAAERQLA